MTIYKRFTILPRISRCTYSNFDETDSFMIWKWFRGLSSIRKQRLNVVASWYETINSESTWELKKKWLLSSILQMYTKIFSKVHRFLYNRSTLWIFPRKPNNVHVVQYQCWISIKSKMDQFKKHFHAGSFLLRHMPVTWKWAQKVSTGFI